jgi:CRP-like cAMP-binding protein
MKQLYLQHIALLQRCSLFAGIDPDRLLSLLTCLDVTERSFQKGAFILRAGQPIKTVGVIVRGSAHMLQEDYWGNRTIIARVEPGELFAEAFCCAHVEQLPVSVQALEPSTVLYLDFNRIISNCSSACDFHTRLIQNMIALVAAKSVALTEKLEDVTQRTTREKLLSYLSRRALAVQSSAFDIPFNRQELADYLSVDRSALSSELSRMHNDALIHYHKNHFELL